MGIHEARRLTISRPFHDCAMDVFGPLKCQITKESPVQKVWVNLYTCFTTRAVILDLIRDCTTETMILSIRRLIARRGLPQTFHSDQSKTYKRCSKELKRLMQRIDWDQIAGTDDFIPAVFDWTFVPVHSPWQGAMYERMVRCAKESIYSVLGKQSCTEPELTTILLEAENIINSRPLYGSSSNDREDPQALSPNELIFGCNHRDLPALPTRASKHDPPMMVRWKHRQAQISQFHNKWDKLYVNTLQQRHIWKEEKDPFQVGDVVVVKIGPHIKKREWPLGVIREVKISRDGKVRTATVFYNGKEYERPIAELYSLEIGSREDRPVIQRGKIQTVKMATR